jgi:hypothetical protein
MREVLHSLARIVQENWFSLLLALGLVAAWVFLRQQETPLSTSEAFDRTIQSGQPVLVEFFNNT